MQDDAPNKVKNNRRFSISNSRSIDAKQLYLGDNKETSIACYSWFESCHSYMSEQCQQHTHMSVIQKDQGLGNVVKSEDAMRRRPKPIKLTKLDEKNHVWGNELVDFIAVKKTGPVIIATLSNDITTNSMKTVNWEKLLAWLWRSVRLETN